MSNANARKHSNIRMRMHPPLSICHPNMVNDHWKHLAFVLRFAFFWFTRVNYLNANTSTNENPPNDNKKKCINFPFTRVGNSRACSLELLRRIVTVRFVRMNQIEKLNRTCSGQSLHAKTVTCDWLRKWCAISVSSQSQSFAKSNG